MSAPIYRGGRPFIKPGIRTGNATGLFNVSGAAVNGTSGTAAGAAGPGSILMSTSGLVYVNTGTKASPVWSEIMETTGLAPISVTGSSVTLGVTHIGRTVVLDRSAGVAVTLPAATGTGAKFRLVVGTASNANTVVSAPATDFFQGLVMGPDSDDTAPAISMRGFSTAATSNKISPTTAGGGGLAGDWIELEDYKTGLWAVSGVFQATTAPATPFSHV